MAGPSSSLAVVRWELSMPFNEFDLAMNRKGFIGPQVFAVRPVGIQAANVTKIKIEQLLRQVATTRAPGAGYSQSDFEFDDYAYATREHGHESPIDDSQLALYRDILDAETVHAARAADAVLSEYERDTAAAAFNTSTFASYKDDVTAAWTDHTNAKPIDDLMSAIENVETQCGLSPNRIAINKNVWRHLRNCDQVIDRVKYTKTATQTEIAGLLAEVLGIEKILVAGGLTNTSVTPSAAAISRIWSNNYALVFRAAETEDPQEPCLGRTFVWTGDGPGATGTEEELALIMEEYRNEGVRGSVLRGRNNYDIQVMYARAGFLLTSVSG